MFRDCHVFNQFLLKIWLCAKIKVLQLAFIYSIFELNDSYVFYLICRWFRHHTDQVQVDRCIIIQQRHGRILRHESNARQRQSQIHDRSELLPIFCNFSEDSSSTSAQVLDSGSKDLGLNLAGDLVLCSWSRHHFYSASLHLRVPGVPGYRQRTSTGEFVLGNSTEMLRVACDEIASHPRRGSLCPSRFTLKKPERLYLLVHLILILQCNSCVWPRKKRIFGKKFEYSSYREGNKNVDSNYEVSVLVNLLNDCIYS